MYILITRYITLISVDAVFDVGSDSDLRRELGGPLCLFALEILRLLIRAFNWHLLNVPMRDFATEEDFISIISAPRFLN